MAARARRRCRSRGGTRAGAPPPGRARWPGARCPRRGGRGPPSRTRGTTPRPARRGHSGDTEGARSPLWRTSETSQRSHRNACPQARQQTNGDQPRRFSRTIALPLAVANARRAPPACAGEGARAGRAAAQVHDLDRRQLAAVGPVRQLEPPQAQPALGPGRGAAGEQRRSGFARPVAGDLARVVARIALLLVGGVVLLVDHHQAEVAHRGEDRRARADADPRLARGRRCHSSRRSPGAQPRMEQRHAVAEARREPRDRLGRQPDLGNEHDRAPPPRQRRLGGRQVDLGLARARDPVQQVLAAGAAVHRGDDRLDRRALLGRQRRPARPGADLHHPRPPQALLDARA